MNNEVILHIEEVVNGVRALYTKAALRIEAIKPGEKMPATQLAEELAKEQNPDWSGPQLYPTLKFLLEDYPGVDIRKGAHGGIYRLLPGEVPGQKKVATSKTTPATGVTPKTDSK